jgi:glycosyltransferase involved in cell wall biosynthesis
MNLNFTSVQNDTSFGLTSLNMLKELVAEGHNVTYWNIQDMDRMQMPTAYVPLIKKAIQNQAFYDVNAPSIRHFHPNMLAGHIGKGLRIGSTFFELNKFKTDELHHLRAQDALITASKWGTEVFKNSGLNQPMAVVPCGVDRSIFHEYVKPSMIFDGNPTIFINCSKTEVRKGHPELIEMFCKAFSPNDNVGLIMNWRNRFFTKEKNDEWDALYKNSSMGHRIVILPEFLNSQEEVASLYASADCGIFPSKAEGFGLAPLEMLSQGKHVIATNYSGHTEFVNSNNSFLIDIDDLEIAFDGHWFLGDGGEWAELGDHQIEQGIVYMREIHKKKQEGTLGINAVGIEAAQKFSWQNSAKCLATFIGGL